ncbi:MAG: hypothetical protein EBS07_04710 [Sphingobacteriia bacterium]|nr:hypothetical protein [Sphingobacteriia bacterium]
MDIWILGLGYTGKHLWGSLNLLGYKVQACSTHSKYNTSILGNIGEIKTVQFLLSQSTPDRVISTIPPDPSHFELYRIWLSLGVKVLLLGSTGMYERTGPLLTETGKEKEESRVKLEREFLQAGGQVLRLSGIYGPGRNPVGWFKNRTPEDPIWEEEINLISVGDISRFIQEWILFPNNWKILILSDGALHSRREVVEYIMESKIPKERTTWKGTHIQSLLLPQYYPKFKLSNWLEEMDALKSRH